MADFACTIKTSATFHLELADISKLNKRIHTDYVHLRGIEWRCFVAPQITNKVKYLGVAVECNGGTEYTGFQVDATMSVTLRRRTDDESAKADDLKRSCSHTFTNKSGAGLMEFVEMQRLLERNSVFRSENVAVALEVELCVEEMKNVYKVALRDNIIKEESSDNVGVLDAAFLESPSSKKRKIYLGMFDSVPAKKNYTPIKSFLSGIYRKLIPASSAASSVLPFTCVPSVYDDESETLVLKDQSTQTPDVVTESTSDADDRFRLLSSLDGFLRAVECQICFEVFQSPIRMCVAGHSVCGKCRSLLKNCPICRDVYTGSARNFALEAAVGCLKFACDADECRAMYAPNSKYQHQLECRFRVVKCFMDVCTWHGPLASYKEHAAVCKSGNVMKIEKSGDFLECRVPVTVALGLYANIPNPLNRLLLFDGRVFAIQLRATRQEFPVYGDIVISAKMFGTAADAVNYFLKLRIEEPAVEGQTAVVTNHRVPIRCDLEKRHFVLGSKRSVVERGLVRDLITGDDIVLADAFLHVDLSIIRV